MDKKELYEKSEAIINDTFEAVKKYAKILAEKTGEAASITKLVIRKKTLEYQITKCFSRLGGQVYQQAVRQGEAISLKSQEIQKIVDEAKKLDAELGQVEVVLEKERKAIVAKPKTSKRKS